MNSSQKTSSKISGFFKKLFASLKPKKRVVFFVLLAVLVFGSILALSNISHASFKMTDAERQQFSQMVKNDPNVPASRKTDENINALITAYEGRFNNFDEVKSEWNTPVASQQLANGSDVGGQVNVEGENLLVKTLLAVIIGVLSIIVYFLKFLVSWSGALVDLALNPNLYNFVNNDMVKQGWVIVRDVCNLFFLLVLIFIALCTILKIEKYHAKKTLLTLIIMGLLINFSKPIAIFIFDGSQLLMNFFLTQLNGGQQSASTIYTGAAKIADSVYNNIPKYFGSRLGSPEIALVYLFSTIFLFILAVAYLVTAIFLIVRIVAIMILIIVSPFAFFFAIIPDFSKMSSKWWSSLFEYSYYGPAAAFFLLIGTKLQNSLPNLGNVNMGGDQGISVIVSNMIQYLVVIIFLYASIIMAKQFGGGAGAAIVGNANKFMKWAGKGAAMAPYRATAWGARTSGVSGAVSQRLQQSKYGRLLTKEGRKEAQEDQEAKMSEKFGVKGAMERQVQKKAKKYKDEHYTEDALKAMAAKGDAAAAFRLAEDGDMDTATYSALQKSRSYKGNVKKMVDKKLKKKQMHIFVEGQLSNFIDEQKKASTYVSDDAARYDLAEQEFGKLNPVDWKEQDWAAIKGDTFTKQAAANVYAGMNDRNKQKVTDDMTGAKYAAGDGVVW